MYEEEGKTISISMLPDELKIKKYYLEISKSDDAKICIVAVFHKSKWTAFIGFPHWDDLKDEIKQNALPIWKATYCHDRLGTITYGDCLPENIAQVLFPDWAKLDYRVKLREMPI